ncbi:hypothetical protein SAMN05660464_4438 [Geodermatophilus dictyosporus]|uniref:Uncharacterized protein n=1 Tax=Geodermatophilus dictyosporus TaxID=1523247 RepID=A0A1I5TP94_9ACTN|nr:hypothetical protein SAMN05660464_4438 [Geodermatophilus dictyosporus]
MGSSGAAREEYAWLPAPADPVNGSAGDGRAGLFARGCGRAIEVLDGRRVTALGSGHLGPGRAVGIPTRGWPQWLRSGPGRSSGSTGASPARSAKRSSAASWATGPHLAKASETTDGPSGSCESPSDLDGRLGAWVRPLVGRSDTESAGLSGSGVGPVDGVRAGWRSGVVVQTSAYQRNRRNLAPPGVRRDRERRGSGGGLHRRGPRQADDRRPPCHSRPGDPAGPRRTVVASGGRRDQHSSPADHPPRSSGQRRRSAPATSSGRADRPQRHGGDRPAPRASCGWWCRPGGLNAAVFHGGPLRDTRAGCHEDGFRTILRAAASAHSRGSPPGGRRSAPAVDHPGHRRRGAGGTLRGLLDQRAYSGPTRTRTRPQHRHPVALGPRAGRCGTDRPAVCHGPQSSHLPAGSDSRREPRAGGPLVAAARAEARPGPPALDGASSPTARR